MTNPYQASDWEAIGGPNPAPRLTRALGLLVCCTIAGPFVGGFAGELILMALPRSSQSLCGNTILEPAMLAGLMLGMFVGATSAWWTVRTARGANSANHSLLSGGEGNPDHLE